MILFANKGYDPLLLKGKHSAVIYGARWVRTELLSVLRRLGSRHETPHPEAFLGRAIT